jgi:6-phosphofructo-2-kinase/fructose-2,6-biphosphatase
MGNGASRTDTDVVCVTLSLTLDVSTGGLPSGLVPAVTGDALLGDWYSRAAVCLRRSDFSSVFWRLSFLLPAGVADERLHFQFGLIAADGALLLEEGGRRAVHRGVLLERPAQDGGTLVRLRLPSEDRVLTALLGFTHMRESVFNLAEAYVSSAAAARRREYLPPASPPRQPAPKLTAAQKAAGAASPSSSVASFQDLVLSLTRSPSGSALATDAEEAAHEVAAQPVPSPLPLLTVAAKETQAPLLPETPHTPSQDAVARRDAGAAAVAAAASNEVLARRPSSAGLEAAAAASAAPQTHLEMACGLPGRVVDASAVSFLAASACSASEGCDRRRLVIALVGLPARGKSFTSHKLMRYLNWMGHVTKHFNVGKYRREFVGAATPGGYFNGGDRNAVASRDAVAKLAFDDMVRWMDEEGGQVGIFDATNSTRERRAMLLELATGKLKIIFLEVVCTDVELIRRNIMEKVSASPDYAGMDKEAALEDFLRRVADYERVYEPLRIDGVEVRRPLACRCCFDAHSSVSHFPSSVRKTSRRATAAFTWSVVRGFFLEES